MVDQRDYKNRPIKRFRLVADYEPPGQAFHDCVEDEVDQCIAETIGEVSDGYHTFNELYAHRIELWITLCSEYHHFFDGVERVVGITLPNKPDIWRSRTHLDGSALNGWFVLGLYKEPGKQITYHLPIDRWEDCDFAQTLERAPEFDGHTSADVLERLKKL